MTKIPSNPEPPQQASLRHPGGGASGNDSRALHQEYTWIHGVIENLPFDVFAIDAEGRYAMQNKACREHWGDLKGKRPEDLALSSDTLALWLDNNRRAFSGETLREEVEFSIDGEQRQFFNIISPIFENSRVLGIVGVNIDITDTKRAEKLMRESRERYERLINTIPHGVQEIDSSGKITFANSSHAKIHGYSEEELCGKPVFELLADEGDRQSLHQYLKDLVTAGPKPTTYQGKNITKDGRIIDVQVDWNYRKDEQGQVAGFVSVITDITQRVLAEEKLKKARDNLEGEVEKRTTELKVANKQLLDNQKKLRGLASQLSLAEERERRRVAVEVHDNIGQNLAFAKMKLDQLKMASPDHAQAVTEVIDLIKTTIRDTRALISELGAPILYELGLVPALEWLGQQVEQESGVRVEFQDDGQSKSTSDDLKVFLFRATRELLSNTVKYAKAKTATVSLKKQGATIQVQVADDGIGFDAEEMESAGVEEKGFGFFSIRERLESLGGSLEVYSKRNEGTRIILTAPLVEDSS